jgi:hypothetical protein
MNRHFSLSPTRHETQNAYHFALCISKITSNKRCKEKTQNAYKERGNPQMGMLSSHLHRPGVSSLSSALLAKALAPGARADLPARSSSKLAWEGAAKSVGACCAHRGSSGHYGACSSSINTPSGCLARCCRCSTCSALAMAKEGGGVRTGPDLD